MLPNWETGQALTKAPPTRFQIAKRCLSKLQVTKPKQRFPHSYDPRRSGQASQDRKSPRSAPCAAPVSALPQALSMDAGHGVGLRSRVHDIRVD